MTGPEIHLPDERGESDVPAEVNRMMNFACRWAPFGGGNAEDIFMTFGVSSRRYFLRVQQIITTHPEVVTDPIMRRRIVAVCAHRLANPDPTGRPASQAFVT